MAGTLLALLIACSSLAQARELLGTSQSWAVALTKLPGSATKNPDGSCPLFPANSPWRQDISSLPKHPSSSKIIAKISSSAGFHPDFGGGEGKGSARKLYGIPFVVVDGAAKVPIKYTAYGDESDAGPFPIPADAPIEGCALGSSSCGGDRHVLVVDKSTCSLYELYNAKPSASGWSAASGATWSLLANKLRPLGWTSADAAGLPVYPGLVRFEEAVTKGAIEHAIRFTGPNSRKAYELPAEHFAAHGDTGKSSPWMGMRVRLRSAFDCSSLSKSKPAQVICTAMKKYGLIFADNGSPWYLTGEATANWDPYIDNLMGELKNIKGSDMEVVVNGCLCTDADCTKFEKPTGLASCSK